MRYEYKYTDLDGDRLIIEAPGWPANTASVSVHGNAVFVPADEAPKAAQAILDAAGVKGVVIVGGNINVTLGDAIDRNEARKKAAEAKKAHDDLRTSPIALKALALYNKGCIRPSYPYKTWDATNEGYGASDEQVHYYIGQVEAKEKEATEKLAARRDALAKELTGGTSIGPWYEGMGTVHKRAIDRIIELEDAK